MLRCKRTCVVNFFLIALLPASNWAQSLNATLTGTVTDPSGAVIAGVELTLTSVATGTVRQSTTDAAGLYSFPNLLPGIYELKASISGFRDFVQTGIALRANEMARLNFGMQLGEARQTLEVEGSASPLNFETAELKVGIAPETLRELPLIVSGSVRSSAQFAVLMPGVITGGRGSAFDARINGGLQSGDEAILDGITMQQGMMSQSGMISAWSDFPWSPDTISEVSVLTSNYEPQYGATTSAQVIAETKSGTNEFHGGLYEYHRNTALNARQFGSPEKSKDIENDFGGFLGGPLKVWPFWSARKKTYFFANFEGFRIAGGVTRPTLSIPSLKNRQGDFTDWVDADGKLIPIFDPATTRPNAAFDPSQPVGAGNLPLLRDQFMGCDGRTPNVICNTDPRFVSSLAHQWFQFLPEPTFPGALNNYQPPAPVPTVFASKTNYLSVRADHYFGDKDHFFFTIHLRKNYPTSFSNLPPQLSSQIIETDLKSSVARLNWDHTFSPTLLNHFASGYLNLLEANHGISNEFADVLPQIPGVATHTMPPVIGFSDGYEQFGSGAGNFSQTRPAYVFNDLLTWVKGKHTFKAGGEYRDLGENGYGNNNASGTFNFARLSTGLLGINSGNPIASLILEAVDNANATFYSSSDMHPRGDAYVLHWGDTWKATPKLSINYGLRWDTFTPSAERYNRLSFFDPLGANPGAGGRPGRLAFAGAGDLQTRESWNPAAAFGRRTPEETWWKGFAPR